MTVAATREVQELYVSYFNRPADPAGLEYWLNVRGEDVATPNLGAVASTFAKSAEYLAIYGQATDRLKVDAVYLNLFGRHGETAGVDYWTNLMTNGTITIDNVVTSMAKGAQGNDLLVYDGRVDVAIAFTYALDLPAEKAAYGNANAGAAVSAYLAAIVDAPTLANAISQASIDALVASLSGQVGGAPIELVAVAPLEMAEMY
jgi:hypothetical protein